MSLDYLPWVRTYGDSAEACLSDDRISLSRRQFDDAVASVSAQFAGRGIGAGEVIAIMLQNRVELVVALMAAWRLGAAVTLVNPTFTESEAGHQIADSGAVLIVTSGNDVPTNGLPSITVDELDLSSTLSASVPVTPDADELGLVIYTSGSTGKPKGVMLTHGNLNAMASMMADHFDLRATDHCLLILPLFHVNAIINSILAPFSRGAQTTILARFSVDGFVDAINAVQPTYFSAVPTIYARLAELPDSVKLDTASLRFAVCGAAPMSAELIAHCEERFGFVILEGYGLTEGTCASSCNPLIGERKLGTVGPALAGQRIAIVDDEGNYLPPGHDGEVLISGPNIMAGYLGMPEETASTVVDGWLHTGDIGHLDDDGYLTLVDRIKDMIIRGGENLYPKEIESVLHRHPDVLESAVVGIPHPVYGEVPVAYVVLYPGSGSGAVELLEHCRRDLAKIKLPVAIDIVEQLPKNPVGKIDKPGLRARAQPSIIVV
ncbi:AMP-dependent synthetase [Rhodococcus erythropolis]|uniref:AMP-dependent synthetase n=1 Tax=Rhodococcus erythropolis TaxID=1833 RepID=A0A5N5E8B1_RHOER|nr:AMP-dependent synthetase [Rhodococcus erythropolis]